jgi:hypothetical protein
MKKMIFAVFAAGATCVAVKQFLPDIQRYLRIRAM